MEAGREVDSFSRPVTENDGKVLTLEEKLEDNHRFETPLLNHIALKQAIDQLPEEEEKVLEKRPALLSLSTCYQHSRRTLVQGYLQEVFSLEN